MFAPETGTFQRRRDVLLSRNRHISRGGASKADVPDSEARPRVRSLADVPDSERVNQDYSRALAYQAWQNGHQ